MFDLRGTALLSRGTRFALFQPALNAYALLSRLDYMALRMLQHRRSPNPHHILDGSPQPSTTAVISRFAIACCGGTRNAPSL